MLDLPNFEGPGPALAFPAVSKNTQGTVNKFFPSRAGQAERYLLHPPNELIDRLGKIDLVIELEIKLMYPALAKLVQIRTPFRHPDSFLVARERSP